MTINQCKIINSSGDSIQFGRQFKLKRDIDLTNLSADVSYSQGSNDGASYQRTVLNIRDIDIEFFIHRQHKDDKWIEEKRSELFSVFNPKRNPMRMEFTTKSGNSYYLNLNLISVPSLPGGFENNNLEWQIGLLQFTCHDPFIYSTENSAVEIASWIPNFSFPLNIPAEGMELSYRSPSLIQNVVNNGSDEVGMIIEFKASATIENPSLINVNTYKQLKLNTIMVAGDIIRVNTEVGKKSVVLIKNNTQTDAFHTLDLLSDFLTLESGDNLFRYDADSGIDSLEVKMIFNQKFLGV